MQNEDTIIRKIFAVIIGISGGFWLGVIIGMIIGFIYLEEIKGVDTSGEGSLGVAISAGIFGIP